MKLKNVIVIYEAEKKGDPPTARKYRKVSSIDKLAKWLAEHKAGHWNYINVYDQKTKQFIERIYK